MSAIPEEKTVLFWLSKALNCSAEPTDLKITRLDEGKGFLSFVFRAEIKWSEKDSAKKFPADVILKFPTTAKSSEVFVAHLDPVKEAQKIVDLRKNQREMLIHNHNAECDTYTLLSESEMLREYLKFPKLIFCQKISETNMEGVLIMECLTSSAGTISLHKTLSLEQIESVVKELAVLHAYSYLNEDWKAKVSGFPTKLFENFLDFVATASEGVRSAFPEHKGFSDDQIKSLLSPDWLRYQEEFGNSKRAVLVHGDILNTNILFKKNPDGTFQDDVAAIIDWQIVYKGAPSNDLAAIVLGSMDPKFWDLPALAKLDPLSSILSSYYYTLEHHLKKAGKKVPFNLLELRIMFVHDIPAIAMTILGKAMTYTVNEMKDVSREEKIAYLSRIEFYARHALENKEDCERMRLPLE